MKIHREIHGYHSEIVDRNFRKQLHIEKDFDFFFLSILFIYWKYELIDQQVKFRLTERANEIEELENSICLYRAGSGYSFAANIQYV